MADAPALELRGLHKEYGGVVAVHDVDLSVGVGEIVGLVGKNGAGKSSLIKMVTGVVSADRGEIRLAGRIVHVHGPATAHRIGIAAVHQELNVVRGLSVAENLALGAGFPRRAGAFVDWRSLRGRARRSLAEVGLSDVDPRADVAALSPVQQRLIMIAVALVHQPAVLILDEPTASFTDREVELLHATMRRLSAAGTGIVFVSHRLDEVLALTDRVVVMRDGAVVAERAPSELDKARLVELITGGEEPELVRTREAGVRAEPVALAVSGLRMTPADEPVSFQVRAGEVLGLAGLVGSGRSELLRAVYGADPRSAGTVEVAGRPVPAHSPRASIRAGMVMLTEDRRHQGLVTQFSVTRNLTLASLRDHRRAGLPMPSGRREHSAARRLIGELAVKTPDPDTPVLSLSGGNQQKVLLGRWLAAEATVLLLDEPTVGVDVGSKADIQNQVLALAARGLAVVVVASEFSQLEEMCHRVLVVSGRAVQAELAGRQITEAALLAACFGASANELVQDG